MKGDDFFDTQLGVSSIAGWSIGDCVCGNLDNTLTIDNNEVEEKVSLKLARKRVFYLFSFSSDYIHLYVIS